jgi:hypothetical protein
MTPSESDPDEALVCWHCGTLVPIRQVKTLAGERIVLCPRCGKTNALDAR